MSLTVTRRTDPAPRLPIVVALIIFAAAPIAAQDADAADEDDAFWDDPFAVSEPTDADNEEPADDPFFDDPFATSEPTPVDEDAGEPGADALQPGAGSSGDTTADQTDPNEFVSFDSLDDLFGSDEIISDAPESPNAPAPQDDLLVTEGIRWRGSIRGRVGLSWEWADVWTPDFWLTDPTSRSLSPTVGADLSFDARPEAEFRAYGKLSIDTTSDGGGLDLSGLSSDPDALNSQLPDGFTAVENEDGDTEIQDDNGNVLLVLEGETDDPEESDEGQLGTAPGLTITVDELFADYTYQDALFFRFGKHTIKWGTGYFFSPADVLNLSAVDPEDPTADREGPISLRVLYPFGVTGNLYLYTITNTQAEPLDVAIAPKVEFAVGNGELAFGGYYQRTLAPRLISLYTMSVREVDLFAEAVLLYGSDRVFVRPSRDQQAAEVDPDDDYDLVVETYEVTNALFGQATVGLRYLKDWEDGPNLFTAAQYFFNGDGYAADDHGLLSAATRLLLNPAENGLAIDNADEQPDGYTPPPALGFGDLANWGRHYIGATVGLSDIFDHLGITVFGLVSLTDFSGIATPALSVSFLDRFSANLSARFTFGGPHGEYTDPDALFTGGEAEPTFGMSLDISLPGGSY